MSIATFIQGGSSNIGGSSNVSGALQQNTYHFFHFSIERITIMLSIWSRCKDARRSFTMKPVELKHRSTAAEEAGMQCIFRKKELVAACDIF